MENPEDQLNEFIARFSPEVAEQAQAALAKMRARLPGAIELVYDNYNALAIGFSPSEKTSDAIFSIAVYPRWVSLFFLKGAGLPDPTKLLKGSGNVCRHIVLSDVGILDDPAVLNLMEIAIISEGDPIDPSAPGRIVIKSISVKQRPRRV
jgi:hypothetical protein